MNKGEKEIIFLLNCLLFDYDRISSYGQEIFIKIEKFINTTKTNISKNNGILKDLLLELIDDEQRMGSDGQKAYAKLCTLLNIK